MGTGNGKATRFVSVLFRSHAAALALIACVAFAAGALVVNSFPSIFTGTAAAVGSVAIREKGKYTLISPLLLCGSGDTLHESRALERKINNLIVLKKTRAEIQDAGVYMRELDSGAWAGVNQDETFSPASLLKVPTMIAYYRFAESHPETLSREVKYEGGYDNNEKQYFKPTKTLEAGRWYTVEELISAMIVHSDNNATALLDEYADKNALLEAYTDLGLPVPFEKSPAADFLSPRLYSYFFRLLYNATYLNRDFSERVLEILSKSDFNLGLVAGVPSDVRVAHKFGERRFYGEDGTLNDLELHDCGIIYYPNNPYLLCVMTRGKHLDDLARAVKELSALVYDDIGDVEKTP